MPKGKKRVLKEIKISEISAVDRPAQPGATATIMKRNSEKPERTIGKNVKMTTAVNGHQHVLDLQDWEGNWLNGGTTSWARSEGDEESHSHPWVIDSEGNLAIGEALGHTHEIDGVSKSLNQVGEKSMLKFKKSLLATAASVADLIAKFGTDDASEWGDAEIAAIQKAAVDHKITGMLPEEGPLAIDDVSSDDTDTKFVDLEKRLAKAEQVAALPAEHKAYFDGLSSEDQTAFLKMENDERVSTISKANDEDPVVATIDGIEIRKSSDPALVAMAKRMNSMEADVKLEKAKSRTARIEKSVSELENLSGSKEHREALIGAVLDINDADVRKGVMEILKAANSASSGDFVQQGSISKRDAEDASEKLNELSKKHNEKNPELSEQQSYLAVLKTAEGARLYKMARATQTGDEDDLDDDA